MRGRRVHGDPAARSGGVRAAIARALQLEEAVDAGEQSDRVPQPARRFASRDGRHDRPEERGAAQRHHRRADVGADERSDRELQVMGAYQGFGYYMWAHLRTYGLMPTRSLGRLTCCFHGSCDVPFARTHSHVCQNTPWQAFDRHGTNQCWFAAGVGHARGLQATPPQ